MRGHNPRTRDSANQSAKPALGLTFMKLYKRNDTWRGAFDLVFIGIFISAVTLNFPSLTRLHQPQDNKQQVTIDNAGGSISSPQSVSANFSAPQNSDQTHKPAESKLPIPSKAASEFLNESVWINNPSSDDVALFEKVSHLIGTNNQEIIDLIKDTAEAGNPNYQYILGVVYINESYLIKNGDAADDTDRALYWYKESASQGHPSAQYQLGQIYRLGRHNIKEDIAESIKWYELAIANPDEKTGHPEFQLGRYYETGKYVLADGAKALEYYQRSAEKGNMYAQRNLGSLYYNNKLVPKDFEKALYWTQKAAEQNDKIAQMNMANMFYRGKVDGIPDYEQFLKWAGLAAENGHIDAFMALGDFYRYGKPGYEIDHKMAAKFYRQAALKKNPKAQFLFGEMYEQGLGVPHDPIQAYVYYNLAYENTYTPALQALRNLESTMTAAELEHAEKMVKALKSSE